MQRRREEDQKEISRLRATNKRLEAIVQKQKMELEVGTSVEQNSGAWLLPSGFFEESLSLTSGRHFEFV
jgi:hypothetical protein